MRIWKLALFTVFATALSVPALAQADGEAALSAEKSEQYGSYLTDGQGRTLYLFTSDQPGTGDSQPQSNCYDNCASAWPPYTIEGQPQVGEGLDPALVGTLERDDGSTQLTYGGWPLYYFIKDQAAGDINGQDVHGFDGEWYLVSPDGSKNDAE